MALPSGYTPLEYIESTGSQYVDTGFKPNNNTRVVMDIRITDAGITKALFGARTTATSNNYAVLWATGDVLRSDYNNLYEETWSVDKYIRRVIDKNKETTTIDGVTKSYVNSTFQAPCSMTLFALNNNNVVQWNIQALLYSCQIYDNGSLIRDFIPCQTPSGEVGLYDDVNGVFYGNAGTGTFVAGPVAVQPEAPASLEVIGTTRNAAVLSWPGAPVGQSYRLYRDGAVVYEGSSLCYTDVGLAAGSTHVYSVHTLSGSTESEGVTAEATTTEGIVLITDRTATDVASGTRKGRYNATDLIRVGEAMLYAQNLLVQSGFSVSIDPKLDWNLDDVPTQAQMERYLTDLRTLRSAMDLIASTPQVPDGMSGLTISRANDIETIIKNIEYTVDHVFAGLFRLSQFDAVTGDRRPVPTANSDMGRNWEELDAMQTTWASWQVASWYLLLYGNMKEEGVVS